MYQAQAVLKTPTQGQFNPAGFAIEVELTPVTDEVTEASMSRMYEIINQGRCDGFIIDLGDNKKKHIIKS
jgi:hypothetical protein